MQRTPATYLEQVGVQQVVELVEQPLLLLLLRWPWSAHVLDG